MQINNVLFLQISFKPTIYSDKPKLIRYFIASLIRVAFSNRVSNAFK